MKVSVEDASMTREALREIGKRPLDCSRLEVHVTHGVALLRGRVDKLRGYYEDLDIHEELKILITALRQKPGIRDVVCEVETGAPSLKERMTPYKHHTY